MKEEQVFCTECGELLTSPRSIRLKCGQRCKWKRDGRPSRKRSDNVSQGMPISDVPFKENPGYYTKGSYLTSDLGSTFQTKIGDF